MRVSSIRNHSRSSAFSDEGRSSTRTSRRLRRPALARQTLDAAFAPETLPSPSGRRSSTATTATPLPASCVVPLAAGRKIARLRQAATEPGIAQARKAYLATSRQAAVGLSSRLIFSVTRPLAPPREPLPPRRPPSRLEPRDSSRSSPAGAATGAQTQVVLDVFRAQIRDMVSDDVLREMLYTYREASDVELRAYVEFLESTRASGSSRRVQGQQAVVEKAVDKVADDFVATVLTKRSRGRPPILQPTP